VGGWWFGGRVVFDCDGAVGLLALAVVLALGLSMLLLSLLSDCLC
jgi:hypothetical protein